MPSMSHGSKVALCCPLIALFSTLTANAHSEDVSDASVPSSVQTMCDSSPFENDLMYLFRASAVAEQLLVMSTSNVVALSATGLHSTCPSLPVHALTPSLSTRA